MTAQEQFEITATITDNTGVFIGTVILLSDVPVGAPTEDDSAVEAIQIAASAYRALQEVVYTVNGESFTTDDIVDYLA